MEKPLSRNQRREVERLLKRAKYTDAEREVIYNYFIDYAKGVANCSWENLEAELYNAMREEKISEERCSRIFKKMGETLIAKDNEAFIQDPVGAVIHMAKHQFEDLAETVFCKCCDGCTEMQKDCIIRKIMKWQGTPSSGWNLKCEYAYNNKGQGDRNLVER